jgi:hypothetical protein
MEIWILEYPVQTVSDLRLNIYSHIISIKVPVVYMAQDIMILMRENPISRAIGRVDPENQDLKMATSEASAISGSCIKIIQSK